jgi:hypothetical protein
MGRVSAACTGTTFMTQTFLDASAAANLQEKQSSAVSMHNYTYFNISKKMYYEVQMYNAGF